MPGTSRDAAVPAEDAPLRLLDLLHRPGFQRLYVHDSMAVGVDSLNASRGLSGNLYAERAVLLAQPGEVVVLEQDLDPDYRTYLSDIGLGPDPDGIFVVPAAARVAAGPRSLLERLTDAATLRRLAERLDPRRATRLSPYYASPMTFELARALEGLTGRRVLVDGGSPEAVVRANRKDVVREQARRLGVPWSEGELVSREGRAAGHSDAAAELLAAIGRVLGTTGGAFVRGIWSMHGADNLRVVGRTPSRASLAEWLRGRPAQPAFLVEPLLSVGPSPNVQMWIDDDGGAHVLAVTLQRLDDELVYRGSAYPHFSPRSAQIRENALIVGRWLAMEGFRGPLGLDFLETKHTRTGRDAALLVEVNGRINGATYLLGAVERLDQQRIQNGVARLSCWRSATEVATPARSFAELADRLGTLLFSDFRRSAGVIPYATGLLSRGRIYMLMVASAADELEALEQAAIACLQAG